MIDFCIETPNLILRKFSEFDTKDIVHYSQQPKVAYWMADMVLNNEEKALSWISRVNKRFNSGEPFIILAIEHKIEGICIGVVGVIPKDELEDEFEIFYGISDEYQRKGYATEACKTFIQWVFENTKIKSLTAMVKPENIASKLAIEKFGFKYFDSKVIPYNGGVCKFNYYKLYNNSVK
ncbi:Protein N-acetyltransferase, RimJ/RimL family [Clostridium cavendishii DSM 21758]|uniref:Protein N-acetyltransferase, RimJ/RimL family n=1 Tax=Clostridium cavendishii DSM 21758 TaxID=1121302 RepID=A0A1M6ISC8_9CLOT|nr:GNAT family N-acetyltransferase [Clostridium cavendishii]SHJ37352.1 Protein N-acetyltransferase, RimJ/RimL family [Clostridium cavendishii DSM 21758]